MASSLLEDDREALLNNFRELVDRSDLIQEDKHFDLLNGAFVVLDSLFMKKSGLGLTEPPEDEAWRSVVHMELANNKLFELPLSPSSPELKVLLLQGNVDLTRIPNSFFFKMPKLSILDLSYTSVRDLPDSLFELEQLRELYLKCCECFMKLSPKIGKLKKLEKLDLDGTQIIHLPKEMEELTNLQSLFLCFYEYRGRKGKQYTSSTIIPSEVISKLKGLKHLSIDVNPDDERWDDNVQDILPEILGLDKLLTLSLYIPHLELLQFIPNRIFQFDFKFVVGRHMQRIISSTPSTCKEKFKQSGCSLKFVNGDDVPNGIKRLVRHSKALFVERHKTIKNLSEFQMKNLELLRICMLAECREMQTVFDGRKPFWGVDIFPHLLYLCISHMKSLKSIWEGPMPPRSFLGMLKSLLLQNCPELTTVFTVDFLSNLSLLKELIIKDCPKVTTLISDASFKHKGEVFLPKLRKIMLIHLPELTTISNGCHISPNLNKMFIYDCPKLQRLSKLELSSQTLEVIKGEIKWWDHLQWSKEEWGISQRPSKFVYIFSSIDDQAAIMTQLWDDNDIDDDADTTPLQTLFEQNEDITHSRITFSVPREMSEFTLDGGHRWRKVGQETRVGSKNPSHYYACAYVDCPVRKRVQQSEEDPTMIEILWKGIHKHELHSRRIVAEPLQSSSATNPTVNNQVDMFTQFDVDDMNDGSGMVDKPLRPSNDEVFMDGKHSQRRVVMTRWIPRCIFPSTDLASQAESLSDGFSWRKYGQKEFLGAKYPRVVMPGRELQLQGPRPAPLMIHKDSHKIKKPPLPPRPRSPPPLAPPHPPPHQPVVIYSVSPKVINVPIDDIMSVVQRLTGFSSSSSSSSSNNDNPSAANHGDMVLPAANEKGRPTQPNIEIVQSGEGIVEVADNLSDRPYRMFRGILSPVPASLSPIPASFFSPPLTADPVAVKKSRDTYLFI